jgi:DNA-binding MarR family transcriptional regulator
VRAEEVNALFSVWLVARATTDLLNSALAPSGLDADEFAIYSVLASARATTPTELARWMAAPPTTVSSYIKRFEARGHLQREVNPDDRRSYRLRLTPAGRRAHRRAAALFTPTLRQVLEALGEREAGVLDGLHQLRTALDEVRQTITDDVR